MSDIYLLGGARTPFGAFCGSLREVGAIELGTAAARAALDRAGTDPSLVDNVVFGNVHQSSADALLLARHIGLRAGCPVEAPALTVNRICGSGLQAIVTAAESIRADESDLALAGGAESLSQVPHVIRGARWGLPLGQARMEDQLWEALLDPYCGCTMAQTAENVAADHGVSREECDGYAVRSHRAAAAAQRRGAFAAEIVPVPAPAKRGTTVVDADEHIRPEASMESLGRLEARFVAGGVVTPGNASGMNDGGAAVVLASGAATGDRRPLARLVSWAVTGVEPSRMGIGPVPAIRRALDRAGLGIDEVDVFEINEAFASQYLACEQALKLDRDRVNVNGGAIALGHPLGASGARLVISALTVLRETGGRYAVVSLCIGGGQGIAAVLDAGARP